LEVREVEFRRRRRGDRDHPRGCARSQYGNEEVCEQEWTEEVRDKHDFESVRGLDSFACEDRGCVDEDVQAIVRFAKGLRQVPDGSKIGQVGVKPFDRSGSA